MYQQTVFNYLVKLKLELKNEFCKLGEVLLTNRLKPVIIRQHHLKVKLHQQNVYINHITNNSVICFLISSI